jgi:hypothetical protein
MVLILYLAQLLQLAVDTETMVKIQLLLAMVAQVEDMVEVLELLTLEVVEQQVKVIMAAMVVAL